MAKKHEEVMELAKRRGFIWPSFEIYGGMAGFYDFGPLGSLLKNKIIQKWREFYVVREGFFEIDSPSVVPEEVLRASGHVNHFVDAMVECQKCRSAFRVVDLALEQTGKGIEGMPKEEMDRFVKEHKVCCSDCGGELGKIFDFNAMFRTAIGPGSQRVGYLRPETAQGIFIDFKRLQRYARGKLPFGVVQIGKGYRNEISPRQGIIRLREFTMAEAEVFFDPEDPRHPRFSEMAGEQLRLWRAGDQIKGKEQLTEVTAEQAVERKVVCNELMAYYLALTKRFLIDLGIPSEVIRFREQTPGQRAHYSSETWDAEVSTERFGWVEVAGLAYRTDYDLSRHAQFSKEDMTIFSADKKRKVLCHVMEPSYGIDRPFYCLLEHSYVSEKERKYLRLKKELAPIEVGVFPLLNRVGMPEKAREV
ncbi:MAG: glycine--tRNA ligase, partial [Hadesarchaea archaeon]